VCAIAVWTIKKFVWAVVAALAKFSSGQRWMMRAAVRSALLRVSAAPHGLPGQGKVINFSDRKLFARR